MSKLKDKIEDKEKKLKKENSEVFNTKLGNLYNKIKSKYDYYDREDNMKTPEQKKLEKKDNILSIIDIVAIILLFILLIIVLKKG